MAASDPAPQLVLIVDPVADARDRLVAALTAIGPGAVASVVICGAGETAVASLVAEAQRAGAAALFLDDAERADRAGADGVHLSWSEDLLDRYRCARTRLGAGRIVGVDAALSRHDAMTLAEAGADYVAFSGPGTDGVLDLVAWWADVFEPPVVAWNVARVADARSFSEAGADFLALPLPGPGAETAAFLRDVRAALEGAAVDP